MVPFALEDTALVAITLMVRALLILLPGLSLSSFSLLLSAVASTTTIRAEEHITEISYRLGMAVIMMEVITMVITAVTMAVTTVDITEEKNAAFIFIK